MLSMHAASLFTSLLITLSGLFSMVECTPILPLETRAQPNFPSDIVSCQKCQADYGSIQNCAEAAPVLANFSQVIYNPGAFIDVIQCSCTETFQAVFPQCVDCFQKTNQEDILNNQDTDLPAVLQGVRSICAVASTILGNASVANNPTATQTQVRPTDASAGVSVSLLAGTMAVFGLGVLQLL